jgi:hypothetical protein
VSCKNRPNRGQLRAARNAQRRVNITSMPTLSLGHGMRVRLSHTVDLAPRAFALILSTWREHGGVVARVQLERNRAIKMSVPITDLVLL